MDRSEKIIIVAIIGIIAACACFFMAIFLFVRSGVFGQTPAPTIPAATPTLPAAIPQPTRSTPVETEQMDGLAAGERTLLTLSEAVLPLADPYSLAVRFEGKSSIPTAVTSDPIDYGVGDEEGFWIWEDDENLNRQVTATLRYADAQIYIWIENGVPVDQRALKKMAETFAGEIYPTNHAFFGSETIPGVDNDAHLYVLFARGLGDSIAGYMSASDEALPEVSEYSNAHEMFSINADIQSFQDPYTLSVMAHELQHLIHQSQDPNEDLWLNEGFAELAVLINGYRTGSFDSVFLQNPDLQLNDWSSDDEDSIPHYGASFLFVTYMMGRFGEEFTRSVVSNELNGFDSIDAAFSESGVTDSQNGLPMTSDLLFADWAVANFLNDQTVGDGRYSYAAYPDAPSTGLTERQTDCTNLSRERDVKQFGTDYIQLICGAPSLFTFVGQEQVQVIPVEQADGSLFMWSNIANSSDMTLTREFDLRGVKAPIELTFDAWYDLEPSYDFGYVLASEDGGATWQTLVSSSCTRDDSTGVNYGCGFNGSSGGWLHESVNLSHFAGQKILLRFESITDAAVLGEGMVVDNIAIPETGYFEDFDDSNGGWVGDGFVRIDNVLPQTFLVSVIDEGSETVVTTYSVKAGEKLEIPVRAGNDLHPVTIVVSGSTKYTRQKALYEYSVAYAR